MPRPTNKAQLLEAIENEHKALEKEINALSKNEIEKVNSQTKWSVKDVIAHLFEWEQMCMGWYRTGLKGKTPDVPAKGYNWAQLPALNKMILKNNHDISSEIMLKIYMKSYKQIRKMVENIHEKVLFTPKQFEWTKNNLLVEPVA
jgi:hypothetical protein